VTSRFSVGRRRSEQTATSSAADSDGRQPVTVNYRGGVQSHDVAVVSHYVTWDRLRRGRKSIALCGDWCDERNISNEPTCPACRKELALTIAEAFGPENQGTAATSIHIDPLADYRPRS